MGDKYVSIITLISEALSIINPIVYFIIGILLLKLINLATTAMKGLILLIASTKVIEMNEKEVEDNGKKEE